jgi:plastocyanin
MMSFIGRLSFTLSVLLIASAMGLVYAGMSMTGQAVAVNTVSMGDNFFAPQSISIPAGSAVEWTHNGALPHTTTSDTALWDSSLLKAGGTFSQLFDAPGTYAYTCSFHPEMVGTVVVEAAAPAPTEAPAPAGAPAAPAAPAAPGVAPDPAVALPEGGGPPLDEGWFQGAALLGALGVLMAMIGLGTVVTGLRVGNTREI